MEGNLPTGHRTTVRTGLPVPTWRLLNGGVAATKSTTAQIDEQTGMLEDYSEVDKDLAELNGNLASFRLSEAKAHLEGMSQEFASTLFYGNSGTDPEEFMGLAPRFSSTTAGNGDNVISAGGAGSDNTSIWLVGWGSESCHGIFPKGSKAGLVHENLGLQTVTVATGIGGSKMRAYVDHFQWKGGIALRDWRYVVRICNIDVSNLVANSGSQADLPNFMIKAIYRLPELQSVKPVFYMNRTVMEFLDIQRRANVSAGGGLTFDNVDGKRIGHFRGIPLKTCDAITEAEATVS